MKNHLKPLFIQAKVDEIGVNKVFIDGGAVVNLMPQLGVFKSKPIQIKTANRSKKTENRTKPNIIGCVWMTFCENRLDWIRF